MRFATLVIAALCCGWLAAGEVPATATPTPTISAEATATAWIQALRAGDLAALFRQLPEAQRTRAEAQWKTQVASAGAQGEQQVDQLIVLLNSPQAVDGVMVMIAPTLVQIDIAKVANQVKDIAGFIGAASNQPAPEGQGLDLAAVKDWLLDVSAWLPRSGLNDAAKARQLCERLVNAFRATGIRGSHEIKQLAVGDLLARLSPALNDLKAGLALYDLHLDPLLASLTVTKAQISGDATKLTVGYTAFGKTHSAPLTLANQDGAWQFGAGKDSPLAGVMQLVVIAMMMNAFNPGPTGEPATPAAGGPL